MTRLQEVEVSDFTGGLNTDRTQFNLAPNESPDMLNIEVDGRRGFRTRKGWGRWNDDDILDASAVPWAPRNTFAQHLASGSSLVYVANDGDLYSAGSNGVFSDQSVVVAASPHLADFASWGDTCYIACGNTRIPYKRIGTGTATALVDASLGFNDDYTTPVRGDGVAADLFETHGGYLFAASIREGGSNSGGALSAGTLHRNRLRWSHPNEPEDWATNDYIDISAGGGTITALVSFQDHLLIFKTDSVWGLYGYNSESWQLIQVSRSVGVLSPEATTRSESAVFFYSSGLERGGVYAYGGSAPVKISENISQVIDEITAPEDSWVSWSGGRLWCCLPWNSTDTYVAGVTTAMVFDPAVGQGVWVAHAPALGYLHSVVQGSDLGGDPPLGVIGADHACLVQLDSRDAATDAIDADLSVEAFDAYYVTPWFNAGTQELRKSWRRPRVIVTQESEAVDIVMNTYWDYNEAFAVRSHVINIHPQAATFWRATGALETNGFDWGDGSLWGGATARGSTIQRPQPSSAGRGGLGVARAVQLRFFSDAMTLGRVWGVNALSLKYRSRRYTT